MKFIRIGICALVVFGIAAHGAVEDWARAVLEIGAALLFLAWAVRAYLTKEHQLIISPLLLPTPRAWNSSFCSRTSSFCSWPARLSGPSKTGANSSGS